MSTDEVSTSLRGGVDLISIKRTPFMKPAQLKYRILGAITVLLSFACITVEAQRNGERPMREVIDELSRIDTGRAVDLQKIKGSNRNEVRESIAKQVVEDFREMQALNNTMMATAWSQPAVDYKYISKMVGEIGKRAGRLKANLQLPRIEDKTEPTQPPPEIANTETLKAQLLLMDKSLMRFVNNPIFQKTSVIDLELANRATRDLNAVIEMSNTLKKVSDKLRH